MVTVDNEDFPLKEVPKDQRRGFWSLLWVLAGFTFFSATMFAGAEIGSSFRFFPDLLLIILVGNLILGSYIALLGYIAAKTGLNTALLARFSFGEYGSKLVDLLLGITQIFWYSWGTGIIAEAAAKYMGIDSQIIIYVLMLCFGFAFCWTAFVGYKGLEILSIVSVPLMSILIAVSIIIGTNDAAQFGGLSSIQPTGNISFATALAVIVGTFVSGGTQSTNWTRFAKTPKTAIASSLWAFFIVNGLMVFMGAYGSLIYKQNDITEVLIAQGLFGLGIVMLFLNIWTTQDNTIYNFSVAGSNFFRTNKRKMVTIIGAGAGTFFALLGLHNSLVPFTIFLSTFIPPIGGIIMADYFVVNKRRYPKLKEKPLLKFNLSGLLSYVIACSLAYYGLFIPSIDGIIASFILHSVFGLILKRLASH